jgi:DNA-binding Xre family transcriptional regulator
VKVSIYKLNLLLAKQCKTTATLQPGVAAQTLRNIKAGKDVRPDVVGRIAQTLGVDPADIIQEGE